MDGPSSSSSPLQSAFSALFSPQLDGSKVAVEFLEGAVTEEENRQCLKELAPVREGLGPEAASLRFFSERGNPSSVWYLSRIALMRAYSRLDALHSKRLGEFSPLTMHFSISHTSHSGRDAAVAVARFSDEEKAGVGVDFERESRAVSKKAFSRFHSEFEIAFESDPLTHWVLKEAAWKANRHSIGTTVSQYEILRKSEDSAGSLYLLRLRNTSNEFQAKTVRYGGYLFAFARET
ncbi:MAG: hypothetical protein H7301_11815 [Cryobacterium sp.]|nr:hypothetical protein [Oligoflexia bacterium]